MGVHQHTCKPTCTLITVPWYWMRTCSFTMYAVNWYSTKRYVWKFSENEQGTKVNVFFTENGTQQPLCKLTKGWLLCVSPESLITQHMTLKWSKGNSDIQNKTSFIIKKKKKISLVKKNTLVAFKFFQVLLSYKKKWAQFLTAKILNRESWSTK